MLTVEVHVDAVERSLAAEELRCPDRKAGLRAAAATVRCRTAGVVAAESAAIHWWGGGCTCR